MRAMCARAYHVSLTVLSFTKESMFKKVELSSVVSELQAKFGASVTKIQIAQYEADHGYADRAVLRKIHQSLPKLGRGGYALDASAIPADTAATAAAIVRTPRPPKAPKAPKPPKGSSSPRTPDPVSIDDAQISVASVDAPTSFALTAQTSRQDLIGHVKAFAEAAGSLCAVPLTSEAFVPFGDFDVVRTIVRSRSFHPIFITGDSGNGKTFQVEQACAMESREYLRVNITEETDEDDLLGGFRLKHGETVFELGPVPIAMLRGAVLLLDEVDLAGPKVMCLQPVLEGRPLTLKKLGITVAPAKGFTVIATANTKGRGNESGRFVGTNLLNEAFLERFPITLEQQYPGIAIEKKILAKTYTLLTSQTPTSEQLLQFETLAKWADAIRATYLEGGIDDLISTRRLVHIVATMVTIPDITRALTLCLNRFDIDTRAKLLDFWSKLVAPVEPNASSESTPETA